MLTVTETEELAYDLIALYESMEDDLMQDVAARLPVNADIPLDDMEAWRLAKLNDIGSLKKENLKTIAKYAEASEEMVEQVFFNAGFLSISDDEKLYTQAYVAGLLTTVPVPAQSSALIQQMILDTVAGAKDGLNLVNTNALESSRKAYLQAINQAYLETTLGIDSYQGATSRAVRKIADNGMTGATYVSEAGRTTKQKLDVVVRRNVLTSSSQMTGRIQIQRANEWGSNLVEVTSHAGARPDHAAWQGMIYSINGSTMKYPNLALTTGYGNVAGLKGANCTHDFFPFFEGLSEQMFKPYKDKQNKEVYAQSQEQRKLERQIREQKRRVITADAAGDTQGKLIAQSKMKAKNTELNSFLKDTGRTKRADRQAVIVL